MQTDWHRYNLKRRVASLPPLSSEIFTEKVLANKADAAATAAKATFEKHCQTCQKAYYSENAFQDHIRSQKHKANLSRKAAAADRQVEETASVVSSTFSLGAPTESTVGHEAPDREDGGLLKVVEGMEQTSLSEIGDALGESASGSRQAATDGAGELPTTQAQSTTPSPSDSTSSESSLKCLFCNYTSPTFPLNISHMLRYHGMFIPEQEYLVNLSGLISHLHRKINEFHACLYCGKVKPTVVGIQTHMRDTGHCMIAFDSEDEMLDIGQFYDFRSTYPDDEGDDADMEDVEEAIQDKSKVSKLGARRAKVSGSADKDEGDVDGEDDGWETDSTLSSVPSEEITSVAIQDFSHRYATLSKHRHHSHTDPRPHHNRDGWHSHAHPTPHAVYCDEIELHLPGKSVGHRGMRVYWRQNLRNHPSPAEREQMLLQDGAADDDDGGDERIETRRERGRQLATRANGGLGMLGVTDMKRREVKKAERRERDKEVKARGRQQWANERQNNFQKHFRDPLLQ
jgi:pre-60S factor REI1